MTSICTRGKKPAFSSLPVASHLNEWHTDFKVHKKIIHVISELSFGPLKQLHAIRYTFKTFCLLFVQILEHPLLLNLCLQICKLALIMHLLLNHCSPVMLIY